ncbi:MAG: sigma-70 family RNA polymerase sigma factor [Bacteroidales bacterium]|nr:sigma-70 family RNA polymerase sigma factor [Bacteroidales bacterium]
MEVNPHLTEKAKHDYQLVKKALEQKDRNAYADLMSRYREPLYFMVLKMTNSPSDAEDLTIEAFGKAFKNLPYYSPKYAFSTWLFRIASNNCIDYLRKRQRTASFVDEGYDENGELLKRDMPSEIADPEEAILHKERLERIKVVVDRLKPHYRKLVDLRYFKEYSYEEISTLLDLPLGTVKAQLFRAREFLQNFMNEDGE